MTREFDWKRIRKQLREIILDKYETQARFAHAMDIPENTLSGLLSNRNITWERIQDFCHVLNLEIEELLCLRQTHYQEYLHNLEQIRKVHALEVEIARYEGLFRGLIYRRSHVNTGFEEEFSQIYWGTLINESRGLLNVIDVEWGKIQALLQQLPQYPALRRDFIRLVLQVCHYLSNLMRFDERIQLAHQAHALAVQLYEEEHDAKWMVAALILKIDGESWAKIETGATEGVVEELREAERIAREHGLLHLAKLAHIFRARALLYEHVAQATHLVERSTLLQQNAVIAQQELDKLPQPSWLEFIVANRYFAIRGEIAQAAQRYDDSIDDYTIIAAHTRSEIELSVGTHCSLGYAYVAKAMVSHNAAREQAILRAKEFLSMDQSQKLWTEDLLTRLATSQLLELEGQPHKALEIAVEARRLYKADRNIRNHNLIRVLDFLIIDLQTKPESSA